MAKSQSPSAKPVSADDLARAFLSMLAQRSGAAPPLSVSALLSDPSKISQGRTIRADLAMTAVLTAKMIASEAGLLDELIQGSPAITIATRDPELVAATKEVVDHCLLEGRSGGLLGTLIVARDGTAKSHNADTGNDEVLEALHNNALILGITPATGRHLPAVLQHVASRRLTLPRIDEWAMALTLDAATGGFPTRMPPPDVLSRLTVKELPLSIRANRNADECVDALIAQGSRLRFSFDGPSLQQMFGMGDAKIWGLQAADELKAFRAGEVSWADVDTRGLLLSGPPGTGKTTFASALAKSAGVDLVSTSVAEWNSAPHLGGTLQAIKAAFANARRAAPAVMLIDEIDGISTRAHIQGQYTEYWTQIVNLTLEELSSPDNAGVIFLAATNYPDRVDPAIKRAGRLDREIALELPTYEELEKITRYHLAGDLPDADLLPVAIASVGSTGADIAAWVKRARGEARRGGRALSVADIMRQVEVGSKPFAPGVRRRIAVHEAGHIVVSHVMDVGVVFGAAIHIRGGWTDLQIPLKTSSTLTEVQAHLAVMLAGRVAERIVFGDVAAGAGAGKDSDLARATDLALSVEAEYGMGTLGPVHIAPLRPADMVLNPKLLSAVRKHLDRAEEAATSIIAANRECLDAIAAGLDEKGFLAAEEIKVFLEAVHA
jgi:hypothetical protein